MQIKFQWDHVKASSNLHKHGVSFMEAESVFFDPLAAYAADENHSDEEPREIVVGHSREGRLLVVCFTHRSGEIRVITARKTTRRERRHYEERSN